MDSDSAFQKREYIFPICMILLIIGIPIGLVLYFNYYLGVG